MTSEHSYFTTMTKALSILILIFCVFHLQAQTLTGKVVDRSTQLPLPQAHIASPDTGEGTITDEAGNFKLILKDIRKAKTFIVSYVGYQAKHKIINGSETHLVFELVADTTTLKEVTITSPDPVKLIQSALSRLDNNHGGQRLLSCFYRMISKNQGKYIQISESAFELNQYPSYYSQVKILKARSAQDDKAFNGVGMGIGTPVGAVKNMDVTADDDGGFLREENLKKHDFFYEGVTTRSGVEVHEISFDQKNIKDALYRGRVYLHTSTLAFIFVEYGLSPKGISHFHFGNAAERAAMKLLNIGVELQGVHIEITYRPFGEKWYLDHVIRSEKVRVQSRRYNFDVTVTDRSEILVTGIDTSFKKAFAEEELTKKGLLESTSDSTKTFWEDYNIIPSNIDYNPIAKEIESRNGYSQLKAEVKARLKDFPKNEGTRVDSVLTYYNAKGLFNGTALVKHKGKVILHKGYGYADKESKIKNDTTTVFRIGSIAKTFTSRLIWQLKQEGLLNYEDSIQRFIPWYPHHRITIHHLLTHSSGIPNYMSQGNFLDSIQHPFTVEQLIRHFGLEKPVFPPGTEFQYSNTGYTLLALIAEKASGKKFEVLFEEKITKPLHLSHTYFARQDNPFQAKGYLGEMIEPYYFIGNATGAGAISSTASDLLKWDRAHSDPSVQEVFIPRTWYNDWGSFYGYGWNIDKFQFWASKKHTIHYHGGTDFGFKSMLARQPDKDNLIVLLNNTGEFPLFDITDLVLDILN